MVQPGRKYQSGTTSYRYSINGQEQTPEIGPNTTTAEYWQYDARIARRWNVDPILKQYESPYLTFAGNPIWISDRFGNDTTKYYDNNNNLLMIVGNGKKGYNRVMIVKDNMVKRLKAYASEHKDALNSKSGVSNSAEVDNSLNKAGFGIVYDIDAIKKFMVDNQNRKAIFLDNKDKYNNRKLSYYGKLTIKGKGISIRSETTGGLILKNNIVTVGSSKYFINKDIMSSSDYPNRSEPGSVGGIHNHQFGGTNTLIDYFKKGPTTMSNVWGTFTIVPGPSPDRDGSGDKSQGNKPADGFRNVMIDDKDIYLYDNDHKDIKIPYR